MTQTSTSIDAALADVGPTAPNPVKPVIVTIIGLVIGILSMVQAYFGSGHVPSGAEISGLLGGAGITVGSVLGFLAHHFGINKAMLMRDAAALPLKLMPPTVVQSAPVTGTSVITGAGGGGNAGGGGGVAPTPPSPPPTTP